MQSARIFDVKEFAVYDGAGIRVTYFLQGCPLRCEWCHNPEGQEMTGGRVASAREIIDEIKGYAGLWETAEGGVTFSGGEPLCQPDFLVKVMENIKGISKIIETSASVPIQTFQRVLKYVDMAYVDMKIFDEQQHIRYTGVSNRLIKENIRWLASTHIPFVIRIPLIPGVSDTQDNFRDTAEFVEKLPRKIPVELLPYNTLTKAKYDAVGRDYVISFDPEKPLNRNLKEFTDRGIVVRIM